MFLLVSRTPQHDKVLDKVSDKVSDKVFNVSDQVSDKVSDKVSVCFLAPSCCSYTNAEIKLECNTKCIRRVLSAAVSRKVSLDLKRGVQNQVPRIM